MKPNKIEDYLSIINESKKMRNLVLSDILDDTMPSIKYDHRHKKGPRVKRYRQQQEYGEKMRIKP
jgi:hypothetical protein